MFLGINEKYETLSIYVTVRLDFVRGLIAEFDRKMKIL